MLNIGHAQDEYGTDHDDHDDNQDEQDDQAFFALQKEASNLPYDSPGGVSVPEYLEELTSPPKKKFSFIKKSAKNVIPPPPRYDHVRPKVRKDGSQSDRKDRQNLANKPQRAQRGRSVSPILAANKRLAKTRHKSPIINHRPKTSSSSSLPEVTNPEIIGRSSNTRRRPRTTSLAQDFLLNVDILDNSFPLEGAVEYESGWTSPSGISAQASDLTTQLRHPRGALWNETDQVDSTQWVSNSDDVSQCCENKDFEQRSGVSSLEKESYGEDFLDIKKEKIGELMDKIKILEGQISRFKVQNESLNKLKGKVSEELKKAQAERESLEEQRKAVQKEHLQLKKSRQNQSNPTNKSLAEENTKLRATIDKLETEKKEYFERQKAERKRTTRQIAELKAKLEAKETEESKEAAFLSQSQSAVVTRGDKYLNRRSVKSPKSAKVPSQNSDRFGRKREIPEPKEVTDMKSCIDFDWMAVWREAQSFAEEQLHRPPVRAKATTTLPGGDTVMHYNDGAVESKDPRGVRKIEKGNRTIVAYPHGDFKLLAPEFSVHHFSNEGVVQISCEDGLSYVRFSDGQAECRWPDGRVVVRLPGGELRATDSAGVLWGCGPEDETMRPV
eukprot:GHVP01013959.1.p1 GENE.GHVP01013959.1~~GHVP01013959.1.p1  ORF type:complete len:613 (+),score=138.68 GHVP01013959.1:513-2351(+)